VQRPQDVVARPLAFVHEPASINHTIATRRSFPRPYGRSPWIVVAAKAAEFVQRGRQPTGGQVALDVGRYQEHQDATIRTPVHQCWYGANRV
jgi:hypothetical protein